jgi:predicted site-specific integrase-resolvase
MTNTNNDTTEILTTPELADKLKVNPRTIDRWRKNGQIPYIKFSRFIRYDWDSVRAAMQDINADNN